MPETNAEGLPPVELTEEQKYLLDTKGWLLVPGALSEGEAAEMRDHCYRLQRDRESVPLPQRSPIGGPCQKLTDHPVVVGFMNEFVAHPPLATPDGYGFRLENSFLALRTEGHDNFRPHGGGGMFNFPGNSHTYHCRPGAVSSGLTRAVWELNPVEHGTGGTMFLTGSHKAAFKRPPSTDDRDSPLWETYACPAGSVLFFTEALCHTGAKWTNPEWDRVAVFNCYNTVNAKWHEWQPHPELLEDMPPLRRTLFRSVHCQNNAVVGSQESVEPQP
ncbi:MAG: phytanoyl-CoA dioxygenase family protein [Armatimonadetes bacterium]|nr:phytanoyl-CoA dioxygenase family protein [Armatimonadota bacterium]